MKQEIGKTAAMHNKNQDAGKDNQQQKLCVFPPQNFFGIRLSVMSGLSGRHFTLLRPPHVFDVTQVKMAGGEKPDAVIASGRVRISF
ncbi:hypothetical protein [Enterobacter sp. CC120223-11]|uniref:hypothetical protein n=1 Tax=Enterobacter sp. CC120223-11 TaxID=1378073 RepID=UPI000BC707FD|nr:hypothetical protein [Enterobacter sp. CC120223-11]SNY59649.1 hypothetical protein SAMN02744775_00297 [Enterobacter sp. CC120223-11]